MTPLPRLRKGTSAAVELVPQLGMDGGDEVLVVIKEQFEITENGCERTEAAEVRLVDEPWDDSEEATVKLPSEIGGMRPGTDVIVVAEAMGRGRRPVETADVLVEVGPVQRTLRVFGPRVWYRGAGGTVLSRPATFETLELRWEHAFGGYDAGDPPGDALYDMRNPAGRGLARRSAALLHTPGPQIEDPLHLIRTHRSRPPPAGVAPIGPHWEPRRRYGGTVDEAYLRERCPLLPLDFDPRYHQVAPPELITPTHLRGGEPVRLGGVTESGALQFELPRLHFYVGSRLDGRMQEHRALLDMVVLLVTEAKVELVWRSVVRRPRPARRLDMIQVHEKELLS